MVTREDQVIPVKQSCDPDPDSTDKAAHCDEIRSQGCRHKCWNHLLCWRSGGEGKRLHSYIMCAARFAPKCQNMSRAFLLRSWLPWGLALLSSNRPRASSSSLQESWMQDTAGWNSGCSPPPIFPVSYSPAEKLSAHARPPTPTPASVFFISLCLTANPERHENNFSSLERNQTRREIGYPPWGKN